MLNTDCNSYDQIIIDECLDGALPVIDVWQARGYPITSEPQLSRPVGCSVSVYDGKPGDEAIIRVYGYRQ